MELKIAFYSYFKNLTNCADLTLAMPDGATLGDLVDTLLQRFPRLQGMRNSMLMAVGVEYQDRRYRLKSGDEIALFPPVQGG
jgi:molybdopterin synthase catalytic subunit